jgi:3-oxoacyl-[acyl-carrier-protein] synthase II
MTSDIIAISGFGSVSPLGDQREQIWKHYSDGNHYLTSCNFNNHSYIAGSLHPDAENALQELLKKIPRLKRLDRTAFLAILASAKAVEDAKWNIAEDNKSLVNIGSSRGATELWEKFHTAFLADDKKETALLTSPLTTLGNVSSEVASFLSIDAVTIESSVTCSTALQAIANGMAWLKAGMAEKVLAGGTEAPITPFTFAQLEALGIYSKRNDDKYPCQPLSVDAKNENTFVLGEAAAVFALEKFDREKKYYAVIESAGFSFERPPSATGIAEDGGVIYSAMKKAMSEMITEEPVDLILMHAPGTQKGDQAELNAIKRLFQDKMPYYYSGKWKTGHTYAASAALNIELAIYCLQQNKYPAFPYPTIFMQNSKRDIKKVIINATGFGGNAASIIVSNPALFL